MREKVDAKARRYLAEGRLVVLHVDGSLVRASCRGAGAVFVLGWSDHAWWCGCPARGRCAHVTALQLVVVREEPDEEEDPEPHVGARSSSSTAAYEDDDEPPVGVL